MCDKMFQTGKKIFPTTVQLYSRQENIKKKREKKNNYMLPYKKPMWIGCSIMMSMERAHGNKDIHECVTSGGILIKLTIGLRESLCIKVNSGGISINGPRESLWVTEVPLIVVLLESATTSDMVS